MTSNNESGLVAGFAIHAVQTCCRERSTKSRKTEKPTVIDRPPKMTGNDSQVEGRLLNFLRWISGPFLRSEVRSFTLNVSPLGEGPLSPEEPDVSHPSSGLRPQFYVSPPELHLQIKMTTPKSHTADSLEFLIGTLPIRVENMYLYSRERSVHQHHRSSKIEDGLGGQFDPRLRAAATLKLGSLPSRVPRQPVMPGRKPRPRLLENAALGSASTWTISLSNQKSTALRTTVHDQATHAY